MAFVFGNCNLTFSPNSWSKPSISIHGIRTCRSATTGTHFSSFLLNKSFSFGRGLNDIRITVSGLANGELKVGSREISSIEQEINFSPTFSDYVKFMESVKLDRSNIVDGSFDDNKSSKRTKKQTNLKKQTFKTNDDNYKEKVRPAAINGKNGGWSQVESILLDEKSNNRDKFENEKSKSNSNGKYQRKTDSFGKIGGTIGESVANKSATEKFAGQKAYYNGQQERLYQEKETKMGNSGTVSMREISKEKYNRVARREHEKYKSEFFGRIGGTIGQSVRNDNAKEKFAQLKNYDSGQQERFYQEKETKFGNEKPKFNSNEKHKRKSEYFGKIGVTIGESVTNKSATEKFAGQKAYDNGQQERLYQEKETKMGNSGTVSMREISKEKYSRVVRREHEKYKSYFFGKIGGTTGQSVRNDNAKEKFAQQKNYDSGQQERFYQEKETKLGNEKPKFNSNEKYKRKSEYFGKIGVTIGESVTNKSATEKFAGQKTYDNGQQKRLYQDKETKMGNSGTVAMREISKEKYSRFVRREHEKYKSEFSGKIGGTIGQSVRNNNSKEKFAQQKTYDNGQQEMFYQENETKLGNFGIPAMHEKSKEKYGGVVRREHYAVKNGKDNSVIEPMGSQKYNKLEGGYEIGRVRQRSYQKTDAKFERYGAVDMQEKAKQQRDVVLRKEMSGKDIDERAAFKTFEVFTDIRNRPRVLRMEMEERIKKLAICLNASDVNIPEWMFSKLMHGAKIRFSDHTILRVVQFLGDYGNWKRALQVVQWLKSRERFKSLKSRYIYTTVLDVLGKAKRPFEALNVFHSMREELASYPDLAAYHCIAVTLGRAGLMKELFDVIDCMRTLPEKKFKLGPLQKWDPRLEPDLVVYNAVLNACVQQKQWEGAFWVLQQLDQKGIRPTSTTYGLVMEVMLACGKYNLVYEFYNKVKRSYIPSALNYKVLLNALWREGKTEEAVLAVKDMEQHGVVGTASLYYDLARCLCTAGRCEDALLQIDKICRVAKKPLVVTYTGLIQTCIDSNNIENARYIFNQMQNFCAPNLVTYNIMLKSYKQEKMFDGAKGLFNEIINGKVVPNKFTFNTMMEACVKNGKFEDFERVFLQMLRHGHHFDEQKHLKMVMDAFKAGKDGVLEAAWQHLVYFGRVPPVPLIMERFHLKLKQGHIPSAVSCIKNFEGSGLQNISPKSWCNLFLNNSNHLEEKHVAKLIEEINCQVGSSKHNIVYENILSGCKRFLSDSR